MKHNIPVWPIAAIALGLFACNPSTRNTVKILQQSDFPAPPVAAAVSVTVTAVNDAPVAAGIAAQTMEDTAVTLTLSGIDADGDSLAYTLLSQPAHGTLPQVREPAGPGVRLGAVGEGVAPVLGQAGQA